MASSGSEEILTTADAARWQELLSRTQAFDFCHLPAFHRLAEHCGQGEARLLAWCEGEVVLLFPLLLREVAEVVPEVGRGWRDVTSVYGYAGPLASGPAPPETHARFLAFLEAYFREQQVVSAFSRLHPLLEQAPLLAGYGEVAPVGWTLSLDLRQSEEAQVAGYRRNHRQDIKKLAALGATCEQAGVEQLGEFTAMYYDTMDKVGASPQYYFSKHYFTHLLEDLPEVVHLFMCRAEGEALAGGIFTLCQGIVQWYFSGSHPTYAGPPPAKLLFEEARQWACARGAHTLHLGGGVGGQRDSLYHFKCGFTHREHVYSVWRHVVFPEVYEELARAQVARRGEAPEGDFFPRYRHPAFGAPARVCSQEGEEAEGAAPVEEPAVSVREGGR